MDLGKEWGVAFSRVRDSAGEWNGTDVSTQLVSAKGGASDNETSLFLRMGGSGCDWSKAGISATPMGPFRANTLPHSE